MRRIAAGDQAGCSLFIPRFSELLAMPAYFGTALSGMPSASATPLP